MTGWCQNQVKADLSSVSLLFVGVVNLDIHSGVGQLILGCTKGSMVRPDLPSGCLSVVNCLFLNCLVCLTSANVWMCYVIVGDLKAASSC